MAIATSGSKIEMFIDSLQLKGIEAKRLAPVLFKTEADCNMFFESFYFRNKHVIDDLLDFREYKISKSKITVDEFEELCYTSKVVEAFEKTFFQPISQVEMDKLSEAIVSGKTSLEKLFTDFQKNPNKNILKNVL